MDRQGNPFLGLCWALLMLAARVATIALAGTVRPRNPETRQLPDPPSKERIQELGMRSKELESRALLHARRFRRQSPPHLPGRLT